MSEPEPSPRISILLPARNAERTLGAGLESILRQTEPDWECVLIDDGSTDRTAECMQDFAGRDARFRPLSTSACGLVAALNQGLARCRGKLVARMDADDVMLRRRLELQAAALARAPELDAVGCHVRIFPNTRLGEGRQSYQRWLNAIDGPASVAREAFVECPVAHPTLMIRRECLESYRYRDMGWPEDYDLILRMLTSGRSIGMVASRLLCWRDHPDRLSRTAATYAIERFTDCKAAFLAAGFLARSEHYILWGHGGTGRALKRALGVHGKRPAQIVEVHPGRLGNVVSGAPFIAPDRLMEVPRLPIVVSVAGAGPRAEIRAALDGMGFRELVDYVCAA